MNGVDRVLHQAAVPSVARSVQDPILSNEANVQGTLNVLIAARDAGVPRVVFASSSSVYGDTPTLPKVETMLPSPLSPYAVTKLTGEHYSRCSTTCTAWRRWRCATSTSSGRARIRRPTTRR